MAENPWKFGDRVEIGGRTMLRPGFSLVGLTGVIFPPAPNVPTDCVTVAIDWQAHGYNEESGYPEGSLPLFVNVPYEHLTSADAPEEQKPKPKFESKSELRKTPEKLPDKPKSPDDEEERPRLRLV
ncbi:MAG TPA: hypothetical protein VGB45_10500 [Abditibacterium sp.]|jgi:hypothetical protein